MNPTETLTIAPSGSTAVRVDSADFDRSKTLLQLKRAKFQDLSWDFERFPSGYYLRNVPLQELGPSEMWVLIRQSIGLDYLIDLALELLETNPLLKCRTAEGDLLSAVLSADALVWKRNPRYRSRVTAIWRKVSGRIAAKQTPENRMLLADYRWFLKTELLLPRD